MNETAADPTGDIQVDPKALPFRAPTKDEILAHRRGLEIENRYNLRPRDDVLRSRNIHEEQDETNDEAIDDHDRSDKTPAATPRESLAADIISDNLHALDTEYATGWLLQAGTRAYIDPVTKQPVIVTPQQPEIEPASQPTDTDFGVLDDNTDEREEEERTDVSSDVYAGRAEIHIVNSDNNPAEQITDGNNTNGEIIDNLIETKDKNPHDLPDIQPPAYANVTVNVIPPASLITQPSAPLATDFDVDVYAASRDAPIVTEVLRPPSHFTQRSTPADERTDGLHSRPLSRAFYDSLVVKLTEIVGKNPDLHQLAYLDRVLDLCLLDIETAEQENAVRFQDDNFDNPHGTVPGEVDSSSYTFDDADLGDSASAVARPVVTGPAAPVTDTQALDIGAENLAQQFIVQDQSTDIRGQTDVQSTNLNSGGLLSG